MLDLVGSFEAAQLPGGELVVSAHGPIDERVVTPLLDLLVPAVDHDTVVALDLTDAHGLDEAIIAVVGVVARLAHRRGQRLGIVAQPLLAARLESSGLTNIVHLHSSLREAIAGD